ncbi:MAG: energy-coupling factor transporter transmembrane component T family protein [Candidatus Xenobia bacterium]
MKHPLTRLMFGVLCAVVAMARAQVPVSLGLIALELAVAGRLLPRFLGSVGKLLGPIAVSTALMALCFQHDGHVALELATRIVAGLGGMVLLLVGTPAPDLALGLEQKGLPTALAYLMAASYQLVPAIARRLNRIGIALQARGARFDGPWWERAGLTASLAVPVIVCELLAAEQRAATLMVRGFGLPGRKSSWRELEEASWEPALRWLFAAWMLYEMVRVVRG